IGVTRRRIDTEVRDLTTKTGHGQIPHEGGTFRHRSASTHSITTSTREARTRLLIRTFIHVLFEPPELGESIPKIETQPCLSNPNILKNRPPRQKCRHSGRRKTAPLRAALRAGPLLLYPSKKLDSA
ncbi:hypothetical protein AVEN_263914-1, partial [Araneus ventricosus]